MHQTCRERDILSQKEMRKRERERDEREREREMGGDFDVVFGR
jgi:hypothetical protein